MKILYFLFILATSIGFAQQPYYTNGQNNVNFTLTGEDMYTALHTKIDNFTNTITYTYGDVRADFKIMDLDPEDVTDTNVLLVYGFLNDSDCTTDRTRNKDDFGGLNCDYNREHVFARSNANPGMGDTNNSTTGIAADPHNLRSSDVQRNGNRGSKKFGDGSGVNSGDVGSGNWYPGDEWRGDVARMMMYMYVRYEDRCLPELNGSGTKQGATDMLQIYLQWNADDLVSDIENNRNNQLETVYGNRNPFIDNPALATVIWGGPVAEDTWGNLLSTNDYNLSSTKIYPNPVKNNFVYFSSTQDLEIVIYDVLGKQVLIENITPAEDYINISSLNKGLYLIKLNSSEGTTTKKLIKQ